MGSPPVSARSSIAIEPGRQPAGNSTAFVVRPLGWHDHILFFTWHGAFGGVKAVASHARFLAMPVGADKSLPG